MRSSVRPVYVFSLGIFLFGQTAFAQGQPQPEAFLNKEVPPPAVGKTWAEGLFDELAHDFGAVPKGLEPAHVFVNNTGKTVHIARLGTSCGGPGLSALKYTLEPGEETAIIATLDTRRFTGVRTKEFFVRFDSPKFEDVRIEITVNSRPELVFWPKQLDFGKIERGTTPTTHMHMDVYGSPRLTVTGAKCDSNYIRVTVQEKEQTQEMTTYQVSATARADLPCGKWYADTPIDDELALRVRRRSERITEELRDLYGQLDVAVNLVREIRDEE